MTVFSVSATVLKSPCFCLRSQAENWHVLHVLPLGDEFREGIAFAGPMRNSGSVWRSAFATTNSDGGMPGRMVRSQDPKELQTSLGAATARYWSNPWATTPAWMKAW